MIATYIGYPIIMYNNNVYTMIKNLVFFKEILIVKVNCNINSKKTASKIKKEKEFCYKI